MNAGTKPTTYTLLFLLICSRLMAQETENPGSIFSSIETMLVSTGENFTVDLQAFENWARTIEIDDVITFTPITDQDVSKIVDISSSYNLRMRTIGASHSDAMLYADEGHVAINMTQFNNGENETSFTLIGPTSSQLYFQATSYTNRDVKELNKWLQSRGLSLATSTVYVNPTLGGLFATGSHGASPRESDLSESVTQVSVVTGSGETQVIDFRSQSRKMAAARCNLGLLGVITSMTLKVVPSQILTILTDVAFPIWRLFLVENIISLVDESYIILARWNLLSSWDVSTLPRDYKELNITWQPLNDTVSLTQGTEPDSITMGVVEAAAAQDTWQSTLSLADGTITSGSAEYRWLPSALALQDIYDGVNDTQTTFPYLQTEFFIQDDRRNLAKSREAVQVISDVLKAWYLEWEVLPLDYAEFGWYLAPSSCYLCPQAVQNNSDKNAVVFFINFVSSNLTSSGLSDDVISRIFVALGQGGFDPVPHLGKRHGYLPEIKTYMRAHWGTRLDDFLAVRNDMDADGIFLNVYLADLLLDADVSEIRNNATGRNNGTSGSDGSDIDNEAAKNDTFSKFWIVVLTTLSLLNGLP